MQEIVQTKVFIKHDGKYLFLQKARDIHPDHVGMWEAPGGKLQQDESSEAAAVREVREETGLSCKIIGELSLLRLEKNGVRTITHVFVASTRKSTVVISDEHSAYAWVAPNDTASLNLVYKDLYKKYVREAEAVIAK